MALVVRRPQQWRWRQAQRTFLSRATPIALAPRPAAPFLGQDTDAENAGSRPDHSHRAIQFAVDHLLSSAGDQLGIVSRQLPDISVGSEHASASVVTREADNSSDVISGIGEEPVADVGF